MKKLLFLAIATLLLLPVKSHAYSISYTIDHVDSGLSLTTSLLNGTLSVLAKTIGANLESSFSGTYKITAGQGEEDVLTASALTYDENLLAVCNSGTGEVSDMSSAALSVARSYPFSTGIATWRDTPNTSHSSFITNLAVDTEYDFYGVFTNLASGYAEASFNLTVPPSATPIPGAIWLLGSGLIGLMGIRRKVRN